MTLSTSQQVRLFVQDQPTIFDETRTFDGTANLFNLPYRNLTSATAFVTASGGAGWTATGCTFDASGFVAFSAVGSANSAYRVRGVQSNFSDDENHPVYHQRRESGRRGVGSHSGPDVR
jgi:hypothetical protein